MTAKKRDTLTAPSAVNYFKEVRAELSKVTWPTRQETLRLTMIVIVASAIFGLAIGAVDYLLTKGVAVLIP